MQRGQVAWFTACSVRLRGGGQGGGCSDTAFVSVAGRCIVHCFALLRSMSCFFFIEVTNLGGRILSCYVVDVSVRLRST